MENTDPGLFIFLASCNPGVKAETVEKELLEQIELLKTKKVSQSELDKVKINTKSDFIFSLESSTSVGNLFGGYLVRGNIKPLLEYEARINAIKTDDIITAATQYFNHDKSTTIILRKAKK